MENSLQVERVSKTFSSNIQNSFTIDNKENEKLDYNVLNLQNEVKTESHIVNSNYRNLLMKWTKNSHYYIPNSFKQISINDKFDEEISDKYEKLNFPILSYSCLQLCGISEKIILGSGFDTICNPSQVHIIVRQFYQNYNIIAYHNFSHGFSLMHMLYQLTKLDSTFKQLFTFEQIGFCLLAGLGHDLNHPGNNNLFQVKLGTHRAKDAEGISVLQKMHIQTIFSILKEKNINIFKKSSRPQKMKQLMVKCVLATDISKHFKDLECLKNILLKSQKQLYSENQRYFCMEQAFHACDISNPCLDYQEYINWAALLTYEFNTQTILETSNKIEVTEIFRYKSLKGFYEGQIGFVKNLVLPLWKQLSNNWPGFSILIQNIDTNLMILANKVGQIKQN